MALSLTQTLSRQHAISSNPALGGSRSGLAELTTVLASPLRAVPVAHGPAHRSAQQQPNDLVIPPHELAAHMGSRAWPSPRGLLDHSPARADAVPRNQATKQFVAVPLSVRLTNTVVLQRHPYINLTLVSTLSAPARR